MLGKILLSCYKLIDEGNWKDIELNNEYDFINKESLEEFVAQAEKGTVLSQHNETIEITIPQNLQ